MDIEYSNRGYSSSILISLSLIGCLSFSTAVLFGLELTGFDVHEASNMAVATINIRILNIDGFLITS